jgi:hypothetical protein
VSHTARVTCKIGKVNEQTMRDTMELVLPTLKNARVKMASSFRVDGYDRKADMVIEADEFHGYGVGMSWKVGGELVFEGQGGMEHQIENLKQLIVETYTTLATQKAMEEVGYTVDNCTTGAGMRLVGSRA